MSPLRKVTTWACECIRCGHVWRSDGTTPPERCARCKSPLWNTPRVRKVYEKRKEE